MEHKDETYYRQVFANNLKHYIQEKGVTQKEVAEALNMSQGAFSDWMSLRRYPRMDAVQKLAEFFGIEKSDLVEDQSVKNKYYVGKEFKKLEEVMKTSPESIELHLSIEQLSPENKILVKALVDTLLKGEK
jgi:transcriptional regulator with XRE-family HTH domain